MEENNKYKSRVIIKVNADEIKRKKIAKAEALKNCPIHQEKLRVKNEKAKATREANKKERERLDRLKLVENERLLAERQANQIMFKNNC